MIAVGVLAGWLLIGIAAVALFVLWQMLNLIADQLERWQRHRKPTKEKGSSRF